MFHALPSSVLHHLTRFSREQDVTVLVAVNKPFRNAIEDRWLVQVIARHKPKSLAAYADWIDRANRLVPFMREGPLAALAGCIDRILNMADRSTAWVQTLVAVGQLPVDFRFKPLEALAACFDGLPHHDRGDAFDAILDRCKALSPHDQNAVFKTMVGSLRALAAESTSGRFHAMLDWAKTAADGDRAERVIWLSAALRCLPQEDRKAAFDLMLAVQEGAPAEQQARGLVALAEQCGCLPEAFQNDAFDALLTRVRALPGGRQLQPLISLAQHFHTFHHEAGRVRAFNALLEMVNAMTADREAFLLALIPCRFGLALAARAQAREALLGLSGGLSDDARLVVQEALADAEA